jgi:shikimate dehydrogenase
MGIPYAEVIGDPVEHSKSPAIHKYWLEQLGLKGDYRATRVTADELPDYLQARRTDRNWRGCNVTMPLKEAVIPLLDEVRNTRVSAVNCIVPEHKGVIGFRETLLRGSNTDGAGVDDVIAGWGIGYDDSRICLIGSGGAARSAIAELDVYCYFTFDLIARDEAKGRAFLDGCNVQGDVYSFENAAAAMIGRHAVINASPLGMAGFSPMPESVLAGLASVGRQPLPGQEWEGFAFDMVTTPVRTAFVEHAEAAGLAVSDGLTMLIGQARAAFWSFFGKWPPQGDAALRELLAS